MIFSIVPCPSNYTSTISPITNSNSNSNIPTVSNILLSLYYTLFQCLQFSEYCSKYYSYLANLILIIPPECPRVFIISKNSFPGSTIEENPVYIVSFESTNSRIKIGYIFQKDFFPPFRNHGFADIIEKFPPSLYFFFKGRVCNVILLRTMWKATRTFLSIEP